MLQVLTPDGYSHFETISRKFSENIVTIEFQSGKSISATRDHRFFINNEEVRVYNLKIGDCIDPGEVIVNISLCESQYVYDVVETDNHKFIANGIVSHNCEFMGSSGTLISGACLKAMEPEKPMYTHDNLMIYKPKIGNHIYAMIVDTSHGKGLDYSAFHVIDITSTPYEQVATFRSNRITPQDYANIIHTVAKQYNDPYILVELNCPPGAIVAELLFWDHEYENLLMTEGAGKAGKKISSGFGGNAIDRGIYTSTAVKASGCSMLKLLIEQGQLIVVDNETMNELKVFSKKGKSYEAEEGKHDDLVMGLVLFAWLSLQEYFKQITDVDVNKDLKELSTQEIDDYMDGLGILVFNDGTEEIDNEVQLIF